jgi:hypothetical protein
LPSAASPQTRKACHMRKDEMVVRATELSSTISIRAGNCVPNPIASDLNGWEPSVAGSLYSGSGPVCSIQDFPELKSDYLPFRKDPNNWLVWANRWTIQAACPVMRKLGRGVRTADDLPASGPLVVKRPRRT